MAKIDANKIEGFSELTPEEQVKRLLEYEFEASTVPNSAEAEIEKYKNLLSKANSEAADYKRQLRDRQSEQERADAERQEHEKKLQDELETLRKDKAVNSYSAKLIELGYNAELARSSAIALFDGDMETFFGEQKSFYDAQKQAIEAAALGKQPPLTAGGAPGSKQFEDSKMADLRKWAGLK